MSRVPKWAVELVFETCYQEGVTTPDLTWRKLRPYMSPRHEALAAANGMTVRARSSSSGRYRAGRISITAGEDRKDQKLVLLHELAHHLTPGEHHSPAFWRAAWRLYARHRLTKYALGREAGYRKAATDVAKQLHIPGARAAAKTAAVKRASRQPRGVCPMPDSEARAQGYRTPHTHYVGTVHRFTRPDHTFADYLTERS